MAEPMSDDRLQEIRETERAATLGPWECVVDNHGRGVEDVAVWSDALGYYITERVTGGANEVADGKFIAAARQDVPDLLAEVDRLTGLLRFAFPMDLYLEIQQVLDRAHGTEEDDGAGAGIVAEVYLLMDQRDQARAEVDRLKAENERLEGELDDTQCRLADALND